MFSKTVHFTIDPQWTTDFIRERWSEGEFFWVFEFLDGCFVDSRSMQRDIIIGKSKFIPSDEPGSFFLADDNWSPNLSNCHLLQYPDPMKYGEMKAAYEKISSSLAEKKASQMLAEIEEERQDTRYSPGYSRAVERSKKTDVKDPLDKFIQDTLINDEFAVMTGKPKPSPIYENGIITPDGLFYRCGVMGHSMLSVSLGYSELEYDEEGLDPSQKALKAGCILVSLTIAGKKVRRIDGTVTKQQKETLKQWVELVSYSHAPLFQDEY